MSFTVIPDTGYRIGEVSGCGGTLAGNVYTTGPVSGDCTVAANFLVSTYVVTPSVGAHGTITPSTPQTIVHGETTWFTIWPDYGYHFMEVTGCGGTRNGVNYTTGPITSD
ncbi:MAG: hypothetical protein HZB43_12665, partial [candidate division Zixibacteria bacterium]|nr:hypothetical protein [candidate division Zixibacteria bacterium]